VFSYYNIIVSNQEVPIIKIQSRNCNDTYINKTHKTTNRERRLVICRDTRRQEGPSVYDEGSFLLIIIVYTRQTFVSKRPKRTFAEKTGCNKCHRALQWNGAVSEECNGFSEYRFNWGPPWKGVSSHDRKTSRKVHQV